MAHDALDHVEDSFPLKQTVLYPSTRRYCSR
jgi:hypothetical protein